MSWGIAAALVAAVLLAFWPGLSGGYLFDDYPVVYKNELIQLTALDWPSLKRALGGFAVGEFGRPLATLSFALNYLAGGDNPWGYKLVGVLIHAFNVLLVWKLLLAITSAPEARLDRAASSWMSVIGAALWALHPLQVSSVLYIVQRMEVLATTFVFISLLVYVKGRRRQIDGIRGGWALLVLSAVIAALGLLSKETAALAGLFALCIELALFGFRARNPLDSRWLKIAYSVVMLVASVLAIHLCIKYASPETYTGRWFTGGERLLTQLRVLPLYLLQMLFPAPHLMHFYYDDLVASRSLLDPVTTLLGGLLLAGVLVTAFLVRRRLPLVALGILWFFAGHAMTSGPLNLELVFEHRNYFALLGVVVACLSAMHAVIGGVNQRTLTLVSMVLVVGLSGLTWLRSATWGDPLMLATELAQENPRSARAATDLAEQYMLLSGMQSSSPFYELARNEYLRAATLPQASPLPEVGLLLMIGASGGQDDPAVWASLQQKLRNSPLGPQEKLAVRSLIKQFDDGLSINVPLLDDTIGLLLQRVRPDPVAYAIYADFLLRADRGDDRAVKLYVEAFRVSGRDKAYLRRIEKDLTAAGHQDIAQRVLELAAAQS